MKISENQKNKNRESLMLAAIEVITEKGYQASTMREIAKKAGLAEATIYNYFPTKEKLVYAYYERNLHNALQKISKIKGLEKFTFRERAQLLIDSIIEGLLNDREFVQETFATVFLSYSGYLGGTTTLKKAFTNEIANYIDIAEQSGEIPEQTGKGLFPSLAWDYFIGVVTYWLKDDSDDFNNTTLLIDKSLSIIEAVIKSGIISNGLEFMSFLYKTHVAKWFEGIGNLPYGIHKKNKRHGKK
ncbi:MAG: TetR family transcriptional regulator [Bacteroidia bacterium]